MIDRRLVTIVPVADNCDAVLWRSATVGGITPPYRTIDVPIPNGEPLIAEPRENEPVLTPAVPHEERELEPAR